MPEIIEERKNHCCNSQNANNSTQREYFNFLRNNSSDIYGAMTWGTDEVNISNQVNQRVRSSNKQNQQEYTNTANNRGRRISYEKKLSLFFNLNSNISSSIFK